MFRELMRDEVFRVETARFWLRWPTAAEQKTDDGTVRAHCEGDASIMPGSGQHSGVLTCWVRENLAGEALNLLVAPKVDPGRPVGFVRIGPGPGPSPMVDYALDEGAQGRDVAAEALRVLLDVLFRVTDLPSFVALPHRLGRCGRRTVESLGFTSSGSLEQDEVFSLSRSAWRDWTSGGTMRRDHQDEPEALLCCV